MELKDFIATAIRDISDGVQEAQRTSGLSTVNPRVEHESDKQINGVPLINVDFDIAVTTTESKEGTGGFKIYLFELSGKASSDESKAHRVKVSIPVAFPVDENYRIS